MEIVEYPDMVFSKPVYSGLLNWSTSGYWGSNSAPGGVYQGQPITQKAQMDATTSGGRSDILTPDTGTYIHADSQAFRTMMAGQVDPTRNEYSIYSAAFYQDEPLVIPKTFPTMKSGELFTYVHVTMRSTGIPPKIVFAHLYNFNVANGEAHDLALMEPDYEPIVGSEWQTYTFDFRYDFDGFRSWPIVDGQLPIDIVRLVDSLAAGTVHFDLTLGTSATPVTGQTTPTWGTVDIAHVVFSSKLVYDPYLVITGKDVQSRRAFGRPS